MRKFELFIGIDVAKRTLAICLGSSVNRYKIYEIDNTKAGMKKLKKLMAAFNIEDSKILICMEHTGHCIDLLVETFADHCSVWVVNPLTMSHYQVDINVSKTDPCDAHKIFDFAFAHQHKAEARRFVNPSAKSKKIKQLSVLRKQLIQKRTASTNQLKDAQQIPNLDTIVLDCHQQNIDLYNKQIKQIDKQLKEFIQQDEELAKNSKILKSTPGLGPVLSQTFIEVTDNFTKFELNWKKMAAFIGSAPYEHESGTSIKKSKRVSKKAHKQIKADLSQAAVSVSTRKNQFFYDYYKAMEKANKPHKWIINSIINMILKIAFTLIKKQEPFKKEIYLKNKKSWLNLAKMS